MEVVPLSSTERELSGDVPEHDDQKCFQKRGVGGVCERGERKTDRLESRTLKNKARAFEYVASC